VADRTRAGARSVALTSDGVRRIGTTIEIGGGARRSRQRRRSQAPRHLRGIARAGLWIALEVVQDEMKMEGHAILAGVVRVVGHG
jgi:hypothetical protein